MLTARLLVCAVALVALMAGCGAAPTADPAALEATIVARLIATQTANAPVATPTSPSTPVPSSTATASPSPAPSATSSPTTPPPATPTATSLPTNTPLPAPTKTATAVPATFAKWTLAQFTAAIQAAGLEYAAPRPMTKTDYGFAPYVCTDGAIRFLLPSVCADCGGRLYNCANQADRDSLAKYYADLGKSSAAFFSWVFARDNLLIQINGDLPEPKARAYETVLNGLK